jgi:hypothetical protein
MPDEVIIPLGVNNIKRLARNLKALAKEINLNAAGEVERNVGAEVAYFVQDNIAIIPDVDGNYLGSENPNASVIVRKGFVGHDVVWIGDQIAFLEWGTGAEGASAIVDPVSMAKAGYSPDPTKDTWAYLDKKTGKAEISVGIQPQAPMFNAALTARLNMAAVLATSGAALREAVRSAVIV